MLDRQKLLELSQYRNQERPVISLYLTVDRSAPEDKHLIVLKNLSTEAEEQRGNLPGDVWREVREDFERIGAWVRDHDVRSGEGVALFACGEELWETVIVPYELPTRLSLSDRPQLRPLYRFLQRFERYLVILSDARDARVFEVTPAETREVLQVEGDTPGRHDQGGWSQARFQRHQDKMVEVHLENAANTAFRLFQMRGFDGVVLMGTEERTSSLIEHLHPYLRQRVLARVPMDMEATSDEIGEQALQIARERRRSLQRERLDEWEGNLKSDNGLGVAGLADTLRAAQQGQLMVLIMRADLHAEGGKCQQCGALTDQADGTCDYCGGEIRRFEDVTEPLTTAAIDQGAELIFLAADGEGHRLDPYGGVGAILRYASG